ncbi:MAG TPA: hypothetical protein VFW65_32230 [Pseudonocardiaceae bacterium]|nr:hypothetical protein [Pseudonocardiaceae bacterium]
MLVKIAKAGERRLGVVITLALVVVAVTVVAAVPFTRALTFAYGEAFAAYAVEGWVHISGALTHVETFGGGL